MGRAGTRRSRSHGAAARQLIHRAQAEPPCGGFRCDIALATRAWAQREPLAEYAAIPAAGHASNLDNPAAFTAALLAFLDRVLGPGNAEQPPSPTERAAQLHPR